MNYSSDSDEDELEEEEDYEGEDGEGEEDFEEEVRQYRNQAQYKNHGFKIIVIEKFNFRFGKISLSAENTIFCYLEITKPCTRQMKENHPSL